MKGIQFLILLLFGTIFTVDHLVTIAGVLPRPLGILPELFSAIASLLLVAGLVRYKQIRLPARYVTWFFVTGLHLFLGIVLNNADSGGVVAGLRIYLKYLPFFLLPLVFPFHETQLRTLLRALLVIALAQLPVALAQRFVFYPHLATGDVVRGTLETSSFLSMFLVAAITVVTAAYLKGRLRGTTLALLCVLLLVPTLINETKGTVVLLTIVFMTLFLLHKPEAGRGRAGKYAILAGFVLIGTGFGLIYDRMTQAGYQDQSNIMEFYSKPEVFIRYVAPRASGMIVHDDAPIGRIDQLLMPIMELRDDWTVLMFGLGMGSVTHSPVDILRGRYSDYLIQERVGHSLSYLIWETGIGGVTASYVLLLMLLVDARRVARRRDLAGVLGLAWVPMMLVVGVSLLYKDIIPINGLMYPLWLLSGFVVAHAARVPTSREHKSWLARHSPRLSPESCRAGGVRLDDGLVARERRPAIR